MILLVRRTEGSPAPERQYHVHSSHGLLPLLADIYRSRDLFRTTVGQISSSPCQAATWLSWLACFELTSLYASRLPVVQCLTGGLCIISGMLVEVRRCRAHRSLQVDGLECRDRAALSSCARVSTIVTFITFITFVILMCHCFDTRVGERQAEAFEFDGGGFGSGRASCRGARWSLPVIHSVGLSRLLGSVTNVVLTAAQEPMAMTVTAAFDHQEGFFDHQEGFLSRGRKPMSPCGFPCGWRAR